MDETGQMYRVIAREADGAKGRELAALRTNWPFPDPPREKLPRYAERLDGRIASGEIPAVGTKPVRVPFIKLKGRS